jgi:hypothetical protein
MTPPFPAKRAAVISLLIMGSASRAPAQRELYRSDAFVITDTSVRQGRFEAVAVSRERIVSSYPRAGREMHFRFSLNGLDNEFRSGTEHTLYIRPQGGRIVTPLYVFGEEQPPVHPTPEDTGGSEEGVAQVTIRLDLRHVLRSLAEHGSYDPPEGPPIRREDFNAVYAIGDVEPLSWDHRVLRPGSPAQLSDPDRDGIFTLTLPVEAQYTRPRAPDGSAVWTAQADVSAFPRLESDQRLLDALHRMSLEELTQLIREDGALSAGAKWPGVWTRDISYASVLSLAMVVPDAVRRSLMAKVDSTGRIIQDTGTGGSWPISTDRMTWALAAWELYAATGDRDWLRFAYDIISRSARADQHAARYPGMGLASGETSFMDWREQSYPRWMDPRDIGQSAATSTNVVHYRTYRILGEMARALGESAQGWELSADNLRSAINQHLWDNQSGGYGTFRYGRYAHSLSPRRDALAEALAVIYGVPEDERRARAVETFPRVTFGAPTFWPYIPDIPVYHNESIWPFVNAFATWAAAETGNTAAVEHGLATLYRPAALFLTNKENMVASTGHFDGTELNSDRQLWSVAGNLAAAYRVLFGIRLEADRMVLRPMVPPGYSGRRTLSGLRYRGARLDITIWGHGDGVSTARLDGRPLARAEIPATITGAHRLELEMNGRWPASVVNRVADRRSPATPVAVLRGDTLSWAPVPGAKAYHVYRNGGAVESTSSTSTLLGPALATVADFQVMAVDSSGIGSFLSEPVTREGRTGRVIAYPRGALERERPGFSGGGYLTLSAERNTRVEIPVQVPCAGLWAVEARYANGSGPINTDAKAAIRTLLVDRGTTGTVLVMPQRGVDAWSDWGYSTLALEPLEAGAHTLTLELTPLDRNMDGRVNSALLDHLRLTLVDAAEGCP